MFLHTKNIFIMLSRSHIRTEQILRQHDGHSGRQWNLQKIYKIWRVKKFIREFLDKYWKSSTLTGFLRKTDKTEDVRSYPRVALPEPGNIYTVEDLILSQDNDDTHARLQKIEHIPDNLRQFTSCSAKKDIGLRPFKRIRHLQ